MASRGPCRIVHLHFDIWEAGLLPRIARADLAAISSTCRSLRTLISPSLFSTISLRVPHFVPDVTAEQRRSRKDILATFIRRVNPTFSSVILAQTRTFHLGIVPHEVTVAKRHGRGEWQGRAFEHASIVFTLLPRLRNLTLERVRITATHWHAISGLDTLESLSITDCYFDFHPHVLDTLHLRVHTLTIRAWQRSPCVEWLISSLVHSRIQNLFLSLGDNSQAYGAVERVAPLNKVRAAELTTDGWRAPLTTLASFFPSAESLIVPLDAPFEVFPPVPGTLAHLRRLTLPCFQLHVYMLEDLHLEHLSITWVQDEAIERLPDLGRRQTFSLRYLTSLSVHPSRADGEKLRTLLDMFYDGCPLLCRLSLVGVMKNVYRFLEVLKLPSRICHCLLDFEFEDWGINSSSRALKNATMDMLRRMSDYRALEYLDVVFHNAPVRIIFDRDIYGPLSADTYLQQCSVN